MGRLVIIASALCLSWMVSPDALVRLGAGLAANRTLFLVALGLAALLTLRGITLIKHPQLRAQGKITLTGILVQGVGRVPAMTLLLASRLTLVLLLPCGLLVSSGYAFNEIFLYWFPNFGFAFLLLAIITLLQLTNERVAAAAQPLFIGTALLGLAILCIAGLGGPASSTPVSMDVGFRIEPELLFGALLLFLGTETLAPSQNQDSRLPAVAALFFALFLFLFWGILSLAYVGEERLGASTIPHLIAAREILGNPGRIIMGIIIISGTCGCVNGLFHLTCSTFQDMAERGLLPGHQSKHLKRRRFVLLFALMITGLMMGGLAGYSILETYIQASLLLWLVLFGTLCISAGRLLMRLQVSNGWQGLAVGSIYLLLAFYLMAASQQSTDIFRFLLLVLIVTGGCGGFWLWRQPAYELLPPEPKQRGE